MKSFNNSLPLWGRVIFVDWYGVLSRRRFWTSADLPAPYRTPEFRARVNSLFSTPEVEDWMLGHLGTESVIRSNLIEAELPHPMTLATQELRDIAVSEMRRARLNQPLLAVLKRARSQSLVVLATDNMDFFEEAVRERSSFWRTFDDVIISSNVRALKRDPHLFFGEWLECHNLRFANAILIDDDAENCARFQSAGGSAIFFDDSDEFWQTIEILSSGAA